jgi:hypothetical protein
MEKFAVGRMRQFIQVRGRDCWTLFDTGARNTYIVPEVASLLITSKVDRPFRSALGGSVKEAKEIAILEAEVEGHRISAHAMVVDDIGNDEDGTPIEILFGALAMQQWGIRLIPAEEKIDLTYYPKEFLEF